VTVTDHRCRTDWAHFVKELLDGRYRDVGTVTLVMDQLNTHTPASFLPEDRWNVQVPISNRFQAAGGKPRNSGSVPRVPP